MATPSAKHTTFVDGSIKGIGVEEVPGIGDKSKSRLGKKEITKMPSNALFYQLFVNEPIGIKPVTAIPGIGPITAVYFNNDGMDQAIQIFGYFLYLQRDAEKFMAWLSTKGCNNGQQQAIYNAMQEHAQQHMM